MKWSELFTSSVGKKFVMGLTGVFLILFLIVHVCVNACIWAEDDGQMFNLAAHFLGATVVPRVLEIGLFAVFLGADADADEGAFGDGDAGFETEALELAAEGDWVVEVRGGLPDVKLAAELETAVGLSQVVGEVGAHERQAEAGDVQFLVV